MTASRRVPISLERLPDRLAPAVTSLWGADWATVLGAEDGGVPVVTLTDRRGDTHPVEAYDASFRGGVRYAVGDVTGDGRDDLAVAAGPGGSPHVKVFDGQTGAVVRSFFAYAPQFTGGLELALGDVNRDGIDDIITAAGPGGGPHVKVFDGQTGAVLTEFMAFEPAFRGGVFVAAGDLNRDGYADVITGAGEGGGPRVTARDGQTGAELVSVYPFATSFRGGVRVAAGDMTGDGIDEIITAAGPGGGPRVRTYDVSTGHTVSDRFAADPAHTGGVRLSTTDLRRDGTADVVARTRAGDVVSALVFGPGTPDTDYRVWVGPGSPPPDFPQQVVMMPRVVGDPTPVRTLTGRIESVAPDGSEAVVRRGDGSRVTVDLNGNPPPAGEVYIDTFDVEAEILVGSTPLRPDELAPGSWVRVITYHHLDPTAEAVKASLVRVLG